jgi:methylmalonyl-CoA/ethylmalonyl-CoA epimerase
MGTFERIDHVGIAVHDLDEAIKWYTDTFGMRLIDIEVNEDQGVTEAVLGVGDGETHVQLIAPLTPHSPLARFLDKRGEGVQQIAYAVSDIGAASDGLRARGVELLYDSPRRGTGGTLINFCHPKSAGGVLVELVEAIEPVDTLS